MNISSILYAGKLNEHYDIAANELPQLNEIIVTNGIMILLLVNGDFGNTRKKGSRQNVITIYCRGVYHTKIL